MLKELTTMFPGRTGEFVAEGMVTFPVESGTALVLQLPGVFQSELSLPSHVWAVETCTNSNTIDRMSKCFIFIKNV
jgi:hypothetical protein